MKKLSFKEARRYAELESTGGDLDVANLARCYLSVRKQLKEIKERDSQVVMDLFYALRAIKGEPTLRDLIKLAKRIKCPKANSHR